MKVNIGFVKGTHIPGHGSVMKFDGVEAEDCPGGLRVTTPAGKVRIPWDRIETVLEAIPRRDLAEDFAAGVKATIEASRTLPKPVEVVSPAEVADRANKLGGEQGSNPGDGRKTGDGPLGEVALAISKTEPSREDLQELAVQIDAALKFGPMKKITLQPQGGKKGRR